MAGISVRVTFRVRPVISLKSRAMVMVRIATGFMIELSLVSLLRWPFTSDEINVVLAI